MPVLAQWPIYPAADPAKGYPSFTDFGEGYLLTRDGHATGSTNAINADVKDWRYSPAAEEPGGHAADPGAHRQPRSDPRPGPRLCRRLRSQAGVPTIFREAKGNIHGFINLRKAIPSSDEDIRGCAVALHLLLTDGETA